MKMTISKLGLVAVRELLRRGDADFAPALSEELNLDDYAAKIAALADFVLLEVDGQTEGCIAFYTNAEACFVYITHYWVSAACRGRGYARQMFDMLQAQAEDFCREVRLEVKKDNPAYEFYRKLGFLIRDDHDDKWLMMRQLQVYHPVIIPTLNRYEHLRRCVESLSRNTYADKTELVIGLDYPPSPKYEDGYRKIKDYLPTITGFKKVTVFEREKNLGAVQNNQLLMDYVFRRYGAVISTEDDNEFSPCFLDYMNKMLVMYWDWEGIYNVSGYLPPALEGLSSTNLIFTKEYNAWGGGTWRHRNPSFEKRRELVYRILHNKRMSWKSFRIYPACFRMMLKMVKSDAMWGDVTKTQLNIFNNTFQVRPAMSLSRNWGYDGSGVNCVVDTTKSQQRISTLPIYPEPQDWEPRYLPAVARATFRLAWPKNNFLFAGKMAITILLYFKYRLCRLFKPKR